MDKLRMIKKSLPLMLLACFLFISMIGCEAQSEKNNAPAYNTHEASSEVLPEQDSAVPEKAPTAGNFTVHYNPATECIQQTFEDGVVVNLSSTLDLGTNPRWATYYNNRIWYVDDIFLYSCQLDGTDIVEHYLPIRLSLGCSSCAIMNDYFYFVGESQIESEDLTLYRVPFSVLVNSLSEAVPSASEERSFCRPFDIGLVESVLEKSDLREYSIFGLAVFQNRLYFDEGWTVTGSYGTTALHAFSWVNQYGEYGTIFDTPLESVGYSKFLDIEYRTDDVLYFEVSPSWPTEGMDRLYLAVLSQDNVSFIGLDDIEGSNYTDKFMNLLLTYEPDADLNALS